MTETEWWEYADGEELADAVAGDIGFLVESALDSRGDAVVALPATDSALPVLERLRRKKLSWKHVTIVPAGDRLIAVEAPESAARRLAERFLPLGGRVLPLAAGNLDVAAAGRAADARLQDLRWPLDLVWLEVGAGGDVASMVAGPGLEHALQAPHRAVALVPEGGGEACVTLTASAITAARALLLSLAGEARRNLLEEALGDGAGSRYPVGRVLADAAQAIDIHWCP